MIRNHDIAAGRARRRRRAIAVLKLSRLGGWDVSEAIAAAKAESCVFIPVDGDLDADPEHFFGTGRA